MSWFWFVLELPFMFVTADISLLKSANPVLKRDLMEMMIQGSEVAAIESDRNPVRLKHDFMRQTF